jgi:hypothetical protein
MVRPRRARSRSTTLAVVALAALALVAGCGDDDGVTLVPGDASGGGDTGETEAPGVPAGESDDGDVCSLLTAAEIEPVVGNPVADGEAQFTNCSWVGPEVEDVNVTLSVQELVEDVVTCETMRQQSPGAEDVAGLGDGAWFEARGTGSFSNSDLWTCIGDHIVYVGLAGDRDPQSMRDASETLMRSVLDRL